MATELKKMKVCRYVDGEPVYSEVEKEVEIAAEVTINNRIEELKLKVVDGSITAEETTELQLLQG